MLPANKSHPEHHLKLLVIVYLFYFPTLEYIKMIKNRCHDIQL